MKILVCSANIGDVDSVQELREQTTAHDVSFRRFYVPPFHGDHRLAAKYFKLQSHHLPDAQDKDVIIWVDSSVEVTSSHFVDWMLDGLRDAQVAFFPHFLRGSVQEEVVACQSSRKGQGLPVRQQWDYYVRDGFPDTLGLFACPVFVRRMTASMGRLFDCWWAENVRFTSMDQISLPYALWKTDTVHRIIPENAYYAPHHIVHPHRQAAWSRTEIINALAIRLGAQSYLEIGVDDPALNFDRIFVRSKEGVDPNGRTTHAMESDRFFSLRGSDDRTYDLIFIDGLHTHGQALRDINHALDVLSPGGVIVVHDCNPRTKLAQQPLRVTREWNGDVWKAFLQLRCTCRDLSMFTVDVDYGCGVIYRGQQTLYPKIPVQVSIDWDFFQQHRQEILNLTSRDDFIRWLPSLRRLHGFPSRTG